MEQENPGCTRRKDFTYPPIIPIVYYEGKSRWTAPKEFKDKIMFGKTFKKFLPNFSYYIVPVHDYSNETLLEHGDEISLVMLINKLQSIDDVEQFRSLPTGKVEEETETLVGKVKEKKMGELFANMDKMDIQAERRKTAKAVKRAEEAEKKAEEIYDKGIRSVIKTCKKLNASKEFIVAQVQEMYACTIEEAEKLVESYWNE